MNIILTMAVSANGIIASKSGSEDFLSHTNWIQFVSLAKRIGCFIWGRKTYEAIITGGSTLNSEFAKRGLINEVIFDVNPSILGEGIPVFSLSDFELKLELMKVEKIDAGIVELHYRVKK